MSGFAALAPGLEAGDVAVDRRDLLAADRGDHLVAALVLGVQAGHVADEVARLVLLEQEALEVLRLRLHRLLRGVDDREVRVRERRWRPSPSPRPSGSRRRSRGRTAGAPATSGSARSPRSTSTSPRGCRRPARTAARLRPLYADSLNERSLRPPMSVTIPTLIFLPASAVAAGWLSELELSLVIAAARGDRAHAERQDGDQQEPHPLRIHGTQPSIGHVVPPHSRCAPD